MKRRTLDRLALFFGVLAVLATAGYVTYELFERPTNQAFGTAIVGGPPEKRVVALTFDDGPNPPYTNGILRVLEEEHVHATFFVVGRAAAAYPNLLRREMRDGDAIGNHTWDHSHLIVQMPDQVKRSLERTDEVIYRATHRHTRIMRPPFGARDWLVMDTARSLGYTVVMWNVPLARDWEYPPAPVIAQRMISVAKDGAVMVLHDGNRGIVCAAAAVPAKTCDRSGDIEGTRMIVRALQARGFRFVTIPELIAMERTATRKGALAAR